MKFSQTLKYFLRNKRNQRAPLANKKKQASEVASVEESDTSYSDVDVSEQEALQLALDNNNAVNVDVCIVGGGIGGLVAAILCHRKGIKFKIVAKQEKWGQGMGFLVQGSTLTALRELGIDFKIRKAGRLLQAMILQETDGSQDFVDMKNDDLIAIGRGEFLDALKAEVPPEAFIEAEYVGQSEASPQLLKLSNGMLVKASLVVGADGVHSQVRQAFCQADVDPRASGVHELVNRIDNLEPEVMQKLVGVPLDKGGEGLCFRKMYITSPSRGKVGVGMVPISSTSLVWYCQYKADEEVAKNKFSGSHKKKLAKELLKGTPRAVQALAGKTDFQNCSHVYMPEFRGAPEYHNDASMPRAVLVGDARGSFSPFTSQGTGSAIDDVISLFKHYTGCTDLQQLKAAVSKHDKERRPIWKKISQDGHVQERQHLYPPKNGKTLVPLTPKDGNRLDDESEASLEEEKTQKMKAAAHSFSNRQIDVNVLRERAFNFRWAESDRETIPLTAADPDFPTAPCVKEALTSYVQGGYFSYGPNRGLPGFREAAAKVLRERKGLPKATAEHVIATNSAATAIYQVVKSVLASSETPGTPEIIVMDPIDFLLVSSVEKCGGVVRRWSITRDGLDFEALRELVNENTVMFSFCNPNNPLGKVFTPEELSQLGRFCEEHDLKILSDDIWSDIVYSDSNPYTSMAAVEDGRFAQRTIQVFGFSKSFGLAGLRIGYITSLNLPFLESVAQSSAVDYTAAGATTLSQVAAQAAYEKGWPWFEGFLGHLEEARDFCLKKCQSTPGLEHCRAYPPQGTYVMLIDIRSAVEEDQLDTFVKFAEECYKIRVVPGNDRFFGPGSRGHVRICFATSKAILNDGLERLGQALEDWKQWC